ncbi:transcription-repair coupling factor [Nevskia ramosa]|uniref:transcription-repair coupling factor n=1 Tax=Nevskia ramosa TaxID=64002 RepID=UPI0023545F3F|nr:transcription-repair coupling factor [Nevskia ramosa]
MSTPPSLPILLSPPLPAEAGARLHWAGLPGASAALAIAEAAARHDGLVIAVTAGEQHAYKLEEELRFFANAALPVMHFPDAETLPYDPFSPHQEILSDRLAALYRLPSQTRGVLIITAGTLLERLPPRSWLDGRALLLKAGDKLPPHAFRERLIAAGYQSVSEVQTQGEFAVRGALIDVFPMGASDAYRLDLFDDEVESIRVFDPDTQRSTEKVGEIRLLPAREFPTDKAGIETFRRRYREYFPGDPARSRIYSEVSKNLMPGGVEAYLPLFFSPQTANSAAAATIYDYLPVHALIIATDDLDAALASEWKQIEERFERYSGNLERPLMRPGDLFVTPATAREELGYYPQVGMGESAAQAEGLADFACAPIAGTADELKAFLKTTTSRVLFIAESAGRREALLGWLKPLGILPRQYDRWAMFAGDGNRYGILLGPLQDGLNLPTANVAIIAEAQVFGSRAPVSLRKRGKVRDPETILRDLNDLKLGAPVVHVEHGVGRYRGLLRLDAGGIEAEYLVLEYADADKLYVPVASLNQIHRYTGAEEQAAPLHNLGSDRWSKARAKAKERAADVAAELLQIQARRAAREGMALPIDETAFAVFNEGFRFVTTPDQQKAIDAVLADMAMIKPMDRVVCGDVGFGKTEVALRAAFAAAINGKQVCVLAPTTLLVQQHEKNFRDRFAQYCEAIGEPAGTPSIRIAGLSRLRTAKEQKALLDDLAKGQVDIVIGTHRLIQDDVRFADLGLVIVDEEHRFGVRHKERLKNLRAEVHLLTLTATPIPRTLNMSMAGLRDLSIIATPPTSRLAIRTFVAEWDSALVYEACLRELRRGGQVYFLHNEVKDIERFAAEIQTLVPEGKVRVAHGQMRASELEQVMLDFYHGRFNILVCTTIIESGIDVPTANTILIDRADHLGLAQLHQLRGRVGRSHHRAYAYLLVPSRRSLSDDANKRLQAIEELGELGSGFALATQDLEIRGAGELLGENQSGQIEEIGFTMYAELLANAVRALRHGKIADAPFGQAPCEVDLGSSALIPDDYVPDVHTRLVLYKRIAETRDEDSLEELKVELIDRFGLLPPQVERLCDSARLRQLGEAAGFVKIRAGAKTAMLDFGLQPAIEPIKLIKLIQSQPKVYKLEGQKRLNITAKELEDPAQRAPLLQALLARLVAEPPKQTS